MSTNEQRIREFAYQIWESEGRPHGQGERHWSMACKLAQTHADSDIPAANDIQHTASTEPIEPISPTQPAQPVTPSDPIQPTDPVQPGQPVQPAQPTAGVAKPKRTRTRAVQAESSEDKTAIKAAVKKERAPGKNTETKPAKPKKAKANALENQLS